MTRRTMLAATAAVAAIPLPARSQAYTTIRISVPAFGKGNAELLYGMQSGIFARHGLEVHLQTANSGSAIAAAVAGGAVDVGKSNLLTLIIAHARDIPFVCEAPASFYVSDLAPTVLVVAKDAPYQTGHDLLGKTVAVPSLGDLDAIATSAWIDQNGGDSTKVRFVELAAAATADALVAGRVDVASMTSETLQSALQSGKCRIFAHSYDAIAKKFVSTMYFTTSTYAKDNVDALARWRTALGEAIAYVNTHPAEMVPLIARFTGMDPKVVAGIQQVPLSVVIDPRQVQPLIDVAARYKTIPKGFDARDIVDPAIALH